ncbi:hypothetical protein FGRMN_4906 [Fusarium graminum]|nr:hypothetical protein FGRMN_4906 [Fusarium graminum]
MHHSPFDFGSQQFLYDYVAAVYLVNLILQRPISNNVVRHLQNEVVSSNEAHSLWSGHLRKTDVVKWNQNPVVQTQEIEVDLGYNVTERAEINELTIGAVVHSA